MKTFWKICGWGALVIVLLFALILAVASPVAKYVVNNYGESLVGRKMHADRVIVNPYWGGVTISGFQCKEPNGETDFVSFDRLYVRIAYPQLIAKHVKLRAIHLDGFNGQVLRSNERMNFSDIIERFATKDTIAEEQPTDTAKSGWTVALDDIRINNSSIRYRDLVSDKQWKLEDISLRVPGLYFDNTQTNAGLEFALPTGGRVGITAGYRMQSNRYAIRLNLYDVHTDVALPLVQDYLNISGLGALLNGSIRVDGSLDNITHIQLNGNVAMAGLSLRDMHDDQVAAMDEVRIVLDRGDLSTKTFILDTLVITGITGDYEVHDTWNTLSRLLKQPDKEEVEDSLVTETPDSISQQPMPASKPTPLVWMAKKVRITGHDLTYHDYSMKRDWEYAIKTLELNGSNIATNGRNSVKLKASLTSDAQLNADFTGGLDFANQDTRLNMNLKGVKLEDFSPLCQNYTGYPLDGGDLSLESHIDVLSGKMKGTNQIIIDHPRVGKKERFSKAKYRNIPVRTGFSILTSAQDMIVLDVPVSGDARNPKFNFRKVIGRALLKVFFGPLMGVNDRKTISEDELKEMQELLEDSTDVAVAASDSVGLSEISE